MTEVKHLKYHFLVHNVNGDYRYIGVAWSDDARVFLTTEDCATYTDARKKLKEQAKRFNASLTLFQGEYIWDQDKRGYYEMV